VGKLISQEDRAGVGSSLRQGKTSQYLDTDTDT